MQSRRRHEKYRAAAALRDEPKACVVCGTIFSTGPTTGRRKAKFCSDACKTAYWIARRKAEQDAQREARRCIECGGPVPVEFSLQARYCSETCQRVAWSKRHPDKYMHDLYRFSKQRYDMQLAAQGGVCAICGTDKPGQTKGRNRRFAIDHDHVTNEIRGLLCHDCNLALGHMHDDPEVLRRAIEYLDHPPARAITKNEPGG